MVQPRVQCPEATQRHEAIERRTCHAEAIRPPHQLLVERLVARNNGPAYNVAVTVQIFGCRVEYEVCTERQRLLPGRGQKRVVHDYERSACAAERCKLLDVRDPQERIARSFDPQQIGWLGKRGSYGSIVTEIDEFDLSLAAAVPCVEQT